MTRRSSVITFEIDPSWLIKAAAWRGKYSEHLLGIIDSCLALDHLARPQSIFALQRELASATPPQHWLHNLRDRLRQVIKK